MRVELEMADARREVEWVDCGEWRRVRIIKRRGICGSRMCWCIECGISLEKTPRWASVGDRRME